MAHDRRDGTPKVRSGGGGGRGRRWDDAVWPGDEGTVDAFPAVFGAGDGAAEEGTVLVVEANRPSAWERMLEALESGELPVQAGAAADDENDVGLRASIAERVGAHAEWPARPRR